MNQPSALARAARQGPSARDVFALRQLLIYSSITANINMHQSQPLLPAAVKKKTAHSFISARRHATLARYILSSIVCLSVCLSVCPLQPVRLDGQSWHWHGSFL